MQMHCSIFSDHHWVYSRLCSLELGLNTLHTWVIVHQDNLWHAQTWLPKNQPFFYNNAAVLWKSLWNSWGCMKILLFKFSLFFHHLSTRGSYTNIQDWETHLGCATKTTLHQIGTNVNTLLLLEISNNHFEWPSCPVTINIAIWNTELSDTCDVVMVPGVEGFVFIRTSWSIF